MLWLAALLAVLWLLSLIAAPTFPEALAAPVYTIGAFICHQIPERSFHLAGAALPVCARCTGLYAGALIGAVAARALRPPRRPKRWLTIAVVPMAASVAVEWLGVWRGTNGVRAATGLVAGGVAAALVLATLHYERCASRRPIPPSPR